MRKIDVFRKHLRQNRAVKIVSGIDNYNLSLVKKVAIAAQSGLASALDVAASEDVIKVAKENCKLPIFASSIDPFALAKAVKWGADAVEIGNFESFYKQNMFLSADEVYEIALETMNVIPDGTFICVTIPAHLEIGEQIELARKLEILGVDLLQTEGINKKTNEFGAKGLIEIAKNTIANTMELSRQVGIPIMSASGLTSETAKIAFAAGASAVGIGSCVNKLDTQIAMIATVRNIVGAIGFKNTVLKEIEYGVVDRV